MSDYDTQFQSSLSSTPALPGDLYPRIRQGIQHKTAVSRSVIAIAASLLISVAVIGYHVVAPIRAVPSFAGTVMTPDIITEDLQSIVSYINSSDLDSQMVAYASLDNGL